MKGFLLDTHIWIWSLVEPKRLSERVRKMLERDNEDLWLSSISVWEAAMLGEKGRVQMSPDPKSWVRRALELSCLQEAPLNNEIALLAREIKLPHKDPADRFIVATAQVYGHVLVTMDENILSYQKIKHLS